MTTLLNFHFSPSQPCSPVAHECLEYEKFRLLTMAFPEYKKSGVDWWEVLLPETDPKLTVILEFIQKLGLYPYKRSHPWYRSVGNPMLFLVNKKHEFTPQEYDDAPFLDVGGGIEMGVHKHLHFDSPILVRIKLKIPPIGSAEGTDAPICSDTIKRLMEAEGFVGFTLTPVVVEGSRQPLEPLWEIWSDRMMPPMISPFVDDDGEPVIPGHYANGCHPVENESPPIYRYTSEAIASMTGVDAAVTHEDFGPKTKLCDMRRLLVSQRFRQWALKNKIKLDYDPVFVGGVA